VLPKAEVVKKVIMKMNAVSKNLSLGTKTDPAD